MARTAPYSEFPVGVNRDETGAITGLVSSRGEAIGSRELEPAQELLLSSATAGDTTGWLPRSANPERFMASLVSAGTASILMDGSNDGSTSAGNIGTFTLDTASQQVTTPPYCPIYLYIRFTVSSASAPVNVGRGA